MVVKQARIAKNNGFAAFTCKFFEHRISSCVVELSEQREAIQRIYQGSVDSKRFIG